MIIEVPNPQIPAESIDALFRNRDCQGRGSGFLRESIRYFHWPFQNIQQESIENGPTHRQLRKITAATLKRFSQQQSGSTIAARVIAKWQASKGTNVFLSNIILEVRPMVVEVIFELLFDKEISERQISLYTQAATNLNNNLKGIAFRDKKIRRELYLDLKKEVTAKGFDTLFDQNRSASVNIEMLAQHFGTTFFYTAVLQITEYVAHTLAALSQQPSTLTKVISDLERGSSEEDCETYLDDVMKESLRLYPLFGSTNRQTTAALEFDSVALSQNDVILLNFTKCHTEFWENPTHFCPERWKEQSESQRRLCQQHYLPFGVGPRSCPAKDFSIDLTSILLKAILREYTLTLSSSFCHSRYIPLGVPAVFSPRQTGGGEQFADNMKGHIAKLEGIRDVSGTRILNSGYHLGKLVRQAVSNYQRIGFVDRVSYYPILISARIKFFYVLKRIQERFIKRAETSG